MESKLDSHVEFARGRVSLLLSRVGSGQKSGESSVKAGAQPTSKLTRSRTRYQFSVVSSQRRVFSASCLLCIRLAWSQALVAGSRFENSVCSRLPEFHKPNLRLGLYVRPTSKGRLLLS